MTKIIVFYNYKDEFIDLFESVEEIAISMKIYPTADNLKRLGSALRMAIKRGSGFNYKGVMVKVYKIKIED